jgi:hypothetical protein
MPWATACVYWSTSTLEYAWKSTSELAALSCTENVKVANWKYPVTLEISIFGAVPIALNATPPLLVATVAPLKSGAASETKDIRVVL